MLLVYYNVICLLYGGDLGLRGVIGSGKFHTLLHCCKSHLQKKIQNFVPEISKRQSLLAIFL